MLAYSIIAILACISGCESFSSKMNSWVGQPIAPYLAVKDRGGETLEEVTSPDANGNKTYIFSVDKTCRVYWNVDKDGIVRSWKSEGTSCKYYNN